MVRDVAENRSLTSYPKPIQPFSLAGHDVGTVLGVERELSAHGISCTCSIFVVADYL